MKLISTLLIVTSICSNAFSQTSTFKCNGGRYMDEHSSNERFNQLIDSACLAINNKNFEHGYQLLSEAVINDSITSGGYPNAFICQERDKLRRFIDNKASEKTEPKEAIHISTTVTTEQFLEDKNEIGKETDNKPGQENASQQPEDKTNVSQDSSPEKESVASSETKESEEVFEEAKVTDPNPFGIKTFSDEEKEEFHNKGLLKLKDLENYIKLVGTKTTPNEIAEQSIENAIRLFDSEDRTVEVSSVKSAVKRKSKIRNYLNKLRLLPYEKVEIEWAEFLYTSDFRKGADGNYYGYISFRQRFTATTGDDVTYTDITTKKTEVILKFYSKAVEGIQTDNWDVFLGDISVEQTDKN